MTILYHFFKDEKAENAECSGEIRKNHHRFDDQVMIQLCTDETSEMIDAEMSFIRLSGLSLPQFFFFLQTLHRIGYAFNFLIFFVFQRHVFYVIFFGSLKHSFPGLDDF